MTRPDNAHPWWTEQPKPVDIPGQETLFKDADDHEDLDFDSWMRNLAAQGGQAKTAPQAGTTPRNTPITPPQGEHQC